MNNQEPKNNVMTENKGRGLFYGVIAVATFIIMAVGATFAYFTATTESMNAAVQTGSTTLQLKYLSYGSAWSNDDLIPANTAVVEYSVENQNDATLRTEPVVAGAEIAENANTLCKDDYGNSICSVYVFQVTNSAASPQSVSLNVVSEQNGFANLNAMAYEISVPTDETASGLYTTIYDADDEALKLEKNGLNDPVFAESEEDTEGKIIVTDGDGKPVFNYTPVYINRNGVVKTLLQYIESTSTSGGTTTVVKKPAIDRALVAINETNQGSIADDRTTKIADDVTINGNETKTFALVLYIKNINEDQTTADAEKKFSGQVVVSSGDGTVGVSGSIGLLTENAEDNLQSNTQGTTNNEQTD